MNRALLIVCFAFSAIALALSLVPRDAPPPVTAAQGSVTLDDLELLERRIDVVEDANRDLLNRVVQLQRVAPAMASDAGVPASLQGEVAQLRDEVRGMIAGEALNSEGGKVWLKETLRELQSEEQRGRMEQQLARAVEREAEQREQWKKFVTDQHLDYAQEQALNKALDAEGARRKALMDEVRAGTKDFREVQRETRDLRRETDRTVKTSLAPAQGAKYDELRREQGGRGFGDRGGGNRGPRTPTP